MTQHDVEDKTDTEAYADLEANTESTPVESDEPQAESDEPQVQRRPYNRDELIVRQCALKAAVDFAGQRGGMDSKDVMALASCFSRWVFNGS